MKKPGPISEGIALAFWGASAVKVAGYSWQAYTGSYHQFPAPGSAAGSGDGTPTDVAVAEQIPIIGPPIRAIYKANKKAESFVEKIPVVGSLNKAIINWVNNLP